MADPGFVQIIEYQTSRYDEIRALIDKYRDQLNQGTARRVVSCADRDRPGFYFTVAEFDSYESAMENSNRPETHEFAQQMAALGDGPATFRTLDVKAVERLGGA